MTFTSFGLSEEATVRELMQEDETGEEWMDVSDDDHGETDPILQAEHDRVEALDAKAFNVIDEAKQLIHIALPSILIQFSLFVIFPQSASAVGRWVGTVELAGFSLGSLLGNLTCLSILEGALTAADTLMPRAYGTHRYDEVARLAIRGLLVSAALLLPPMIPLWFYADALLVALGQDPEASQLAQAWIRWYFVGVPPNVVYRVAMRFLLAQHQPWPHVYTSVVPCVLLHPLFLRMLVPRYGLPGSAMALSLTQWSMVILLALYLYIQKPCKPETWPGLSVRLMQEACRPEPLLKFVSLSLGGVFSLSEWWFWEIMCFIAGSFGVVSLVAHTIAYNLVPLVFMLPLGIMVGLAVRMGHVITHDPHRAQQLAAWCMGAIILLGALVAGMLYMLRLPIIHLFTTDDEYVVPVCLHIWPSVCAYIFLLYIFGISNAIYRGLGMQWRLAAITSAMLYLFLLPTVVYWAVMRHGGLYTQWKLMPAFYVILQIVLASGYLIVDWSAHSRIIQENMAESMRKSCRHRATTGNDASDFIKQQLSEEEEDEEINGTNSGKDIRDRNVNGHQQPPGESTPLIR